MPRQPCSHANAYATNKECDYLAVAGRRGASEADRKRVAFIAHFQWFDMKSKDDTEDIPFVDLKEAEALLNAYFPPDGTVVW